MLMKAGKLPSKSSNVCIFTARLACMYFAQSNRLKHRLIVVESSMNIFNLILNFACLNLERSNFELILENKNLFAIEESFFCCTTES